MSGGNGERMSVEQDRPVLSARGLSVTFPGPRGGQPVRAVDGVNLDVHPWEILALVGESGCGKTTLARTLMGLERPSAGEVRFAGVALDYSTRSLRAYRRRVQLVLQDPTGSLNPRHSVYEAVAEGLRIHGAEALGSFGNEEAKVADALSRAGLRPPERFVPPYPHEPSGRQRQRVVIAGALVLDPQVIVADEPVASLDASVRGEILKLLLALRDASGLSALVPTPDPARAWHVADPAPGMHP